MINVFFVIPVLGGGGAEKVMLHLLLYIDRKRFKPQLILFERKGELLPNLPDDIGIKVLKDDDSILWRIWGLTWIILAIRLARLLRNDKPNVIVSFMWYTNFVALTGKFLSGIACRAIVSERYGLSFSYEGRFTEFLRKVIIRFFYPRADKIITNSKVMVLQLTGMCNIPKEKISVIHNPVDVKQINQLYAKDVDHIWYKEQVPIITAIGRLTPQKGFAYLLKAVNKLLSEGIQCRLVILGKGTERENLEKLSVELGISSYILFLGFQENPYKYLVRSTVFVLSSLYEGFPNALLEALALGVPSIATRCPTGPTEIITNGVDGMLVPPANEEALAGAIKKLLIDKDLRTRLGDAGKERAEDFRVEKIIKQYENMIEG